MPLVKRLQISGDGAASALCPEEEQTSRNSGTFIGSSSIKAMQTQGQNPYLLEGLLKKAAPWERRLFSSTLVPVATKSERDPLRGFRLWEITRGVISKTEEVYRTLLRRATGPLPPTQLHGYRPCFFLLPPLLSSAYGDAPGKESTGGNES